MRACPELQEISLHCSISVHPSLPSTIPRSRLCYPLQQSRNDVITHLRQAKHLSVVEIYLAGSMADLGEKKAWKAGLIDVLKNSPSKHRKFLRWNVVKFYVGPRRRHGCQSVLETEELEVFPESPP